MVVHNQRIGMEFAGDPEGQFLVADSTVIHDGRIAERSPGDRERNYAALVVDDFMSAEGGYWVGSAIVAHFDANNQIAAAQPGRFGSIFKSRRHDRGNSVLG